MRPDATSPRTPGSAGRGRLAPARRFCPAALASLFVSLVLLAPPPAKAAPEGVDAFRRIAVLEDRRDLAGGEVVRFLEHDDARVRARAARALGRIGEVSTLEALAARLDDRDPGVRREVAFSLGQMWTTLAEPALLDALHGEKNAEVRLSLLEALGKCGGVKSVRALRPFLTPAPTPERLEAALALGAMGWRKINTDEAADQAATALMADVNAPDAWALSYACYRATGKNASNGVLAALRSKDPQALIFALKSLTAGKISPSLAEDVVPLLEHPDWRVRCEAVAAIGKLQAFTHAYYAQRKSQDDASLSVRLAAIQALRDLPDGGSFDVLVALLEDPDVRIRAAAILALANIHGTGAFAPMRAHFDSESWMVRAACGEALGLEGPDLAERPLEKFLGDPDVRVVAATLGGCAKLPLRNVRGHLLEHLRANEDVSVVAGAAEALAALKDSTAVPDLVEVYRRLAVPGDVEAMTSILDAVGSLGDTSVVAFLETEAASREPAIERGALAALKKITGVERPLTVRALPDSTPSPDFAALDALGTPRVRVVTELGEIVLELDPAEAPNTVLSFLRLADRGYFDGLTFHRVVPNFVIQGGDPRGDGWGGPGYSIRDEFNPLRYERGMLGMALSGKDTGGSQFFITHSAQPHLNGRYTIFGRVVEGMDVVDRIQRGDTITAVRRVQG